MDTGKGGAVQQFNYCQQCRRSIPPSEWKSHKYTSKHKKFVGYYAASVRKSIGDVLPSQISEDTARVFHCLLCDWLPDEDSVVGDPINSCRKQVWAHLASPAHSKSLDRFIHECRGVIADLKKESLSLTPTQVQKRVMDLLQQSEKSLEPRQTTETPPSSNVPTANSNPWPAFAEPAKPQTPRTLVSRSGVLQNPTGSHNGARVWGGGIVKLSADEWIPWELDERESSLAQRPLSGDSRPAEPLLSLSEPNSRPLMNPEALGLTRVTLPRNVAEHSLPGVLPGQTAAPWLQVPVTSSLATLVPHGGTLAQLADIYRQKMKNAKKNPNRVGAKWANERLRQIQQQILSSVQKSPAVESKEQAEWLPKFGGVWNEGPRSQHLKTFRESDQRNS